MINNANKALGYAEVYYNYRTEKFFTDAVGNQFQELDITFEGGGSDNSTLDDVTGRGSTTTNDISIGRLTASKIGLPSFSTLPTTNLNFGDLCALTSDNRPYFYDGSDWRKLYLVDVPPAAGDPDTDWDQVLLRATFDTDLNDQSDNGFNKDHSTTAVRVGSPKKYGSHSAKLEESALWWENIPVFLESAFTIEFWLYLDSYATDASSSVVTLVNHNNAYFEYSIDSNAFSLLLFQLDDGTSVTSFGSSITVARQTWHHIAFTRNATSGVISFYLNGTFRGSVSGNNLSTTSDYIGIGDHQYGDMFVDDLRVSTFERYTSTFTPPTAALPISD